MPAHLPGGDGRPGGIVGYPLDRLYEEVAFLAYYFHWSLAEILDLEHSDRRRFMDEISAINRQLNEQTDTGGSEPSRGIPLEVWVGLT